MKKFYSAALAMLVTLLLPVVVLAAGKEIIILHTNDIHCGITDNLGIDKVSQYKKDLKKQGYPVALVDAGDAIQGAPIGKLSTGESIVKIMNAVGYDFVIPGNHEFDYGMERFLQLASRQKCGYYSCNFVDVKTRKPILKPYKIIVLGGKKIGFVGVTTPETLVTSTPKYFQDKDGKFIYGFCEDQTGEKVYAAVQRAVNNVRKEGADYVFLVGHLGTDGSIPYWSSGAIAANTYNIDGIIDGHSHEQYIPPHKIINKAGKEVLVAQTGTKLQSLGKMTIKEDGTITSELVKGLKAADPKITKLVAKENKKFEPILKQPVGEALVDLTGDDPKYNDLLKAFPFGNMCTVIEATGQQIVDALEVGASAYPNEHGAFMQVSGMSYTIDSSIPSGLVIDAKGNFVEIKGERRVKDVKINGKPIDLNGKYTVGGITYVLKDGGNGLVMFKQSKLLKDGIMTDVDAVTEYVQNHLNAKIKEGYENPYGAGRITIK